MKKSILLISLILFLPSLMLAQGGSGIGGGGTNVGGGLLVQQFPGAPSGTCSTGALAQNAATGALYDCVAGTWTLVGGGGGGSGTVTSIATTSPITGGTITATGTIACATCAIGPGSSTAGHLATFTNTDGVTLSDGGAVPSGTVTSIATTSPIGGGTITATGTLTCTTCVVASSPGVGLAHFAGSTQTVTSSAVDLSGADVTGNLGVAHLNSGTSASSSTFWRGDATWAAVSSGNAFAQTIGLGTLTPPDLSTFTAATNTGCSLTYSAGNYENVKNTGTSGDCIYWKSLPAAPYTITMAFMPSSIAGTTGDACDLAIFPSSSQSTTYRYFSTTNISGTPAFWRYGWSSSAGDVKLVTSGFSQGAATVFLFRIKDDATNRITSQSADGGVTWEQYNSEVNSTQFTAANYGVRMNTSAGATSAGLGCTILHLAVTTP